MMMMLKNRYTFDFLFTSSHNVHNSETRAVTGVILTLTSSNMLPTQNSGRHPLDVPVLTSASTHTDPPAVTWPVYLRRRIHHRTICTFTGRIVQLDSPD